MSLALAAWNTDARSAFEELQGAHRTIGGADPGRRTGTQQLNYAYVLLLSARFQAYCRDLHSEATVHVRDGVPAALSPLIYRAMIRNRALDLVETINGVVAEQVETLVGTRPW